jgi:hypothetical protein
MFPSIIQEEGLPFLGYSYPKDTVLIIARKHWINRNFKKHKKIAGLSFFKVLK